MVDMAEDIPQLDTPAMRQYRQMKEQYPDYLLLFRMGDFYEMFYEDAKTASRLLGLTLTSRSKGPTAVPLAGIPYHALDSYLRRLVAAGQRVAICEQVEDPKLAKGLVKRDVQRLVTPGTLTDEALLDQREGNYLAAVFPYPRPAPAHTTVSPVSVAEAAISAAGGLHEAAPPADGASAGLAWVELSSGLFQMMELPLSEVHDELTRIRPAEVLVPEGSPLDQPAFRQALRDALGAVCTSRPPWAFEAHAATEALRGQFQVATLEGFGVRAYGPDVSAAGGIIDYLRETQKTALAHIRQLRRLDRGNHMMLDGTTLRSLEIHRTLRANQRAGSLLACVQPQGRLQQGLRLLHRDHQRSTPTRSPPTTSASRRSRTPSATSPPS
jgi:DNA mismatch repair protein MutS